jgi:hypothetical protein
MKLVVANSVPAFLGFLLLSASSVLLVLTFKGPHFLLSNLIPFLGSLDHDSNETNAELSSFSLEEIPVTMLQTGALRSVLPVVSVPSYTDEEGSTVRGSAGRQLKSDKGSKSGKGSKSEKKRSKKRKYAKFRPTYNRPSAANRPPSCGSIKSGKKSKSQGTFAVAVKDFSDATADAPLESFGTSPELRRDITLLLTVPAATDIYLVEGIIVTIRQRSLVSYSDFTCPPAGYTKQTENAAGKAFFRIPGDISSVTVFCDDDENVIGIYVHVVFPDDEDSSDCEEDEDTDSPTVSPAPSLFQAAETPAPTISLAPSMLDGLESELPTVSAAPSGPETPLETVSPAPSLLPSVLPSAFPTVSAEPSTSDGLDTPLPVTSQSPSVTPSVTPLTDSTAPSSGPSVLPSALPSAGPSVAPSEFPTTTAVVV